MIKKGGGRRPRGRAMLSLPARSRVGPPWPNAISNTIDRTMVETNASHLPACAWRLRRASDSLGLQRGASEDSAQLRPGRGHGRRLLLARRASVAGRAHLAVAGPRILDLLQRKGWKVPRQQELIDRALDDSDPWSASCAPRMDESSRARCRTFRRDTIASTGWFGCRPARASCGAGPHARRLQAVRIL